MNTNYLIGLNILTYLGIYLNSEALENFKDKFERYYIDELNRKKTLDMSDLVAITRKAHSHIYEDTFGESKILLYIFDEKYKRSQLSRIIGGELHEKLEEMLIQEFFYRRRN